MKDLKKFVGKKESKKQKITEAETGGMKLPETLPDITDFDQKDVDLVKNLTKRYNGNKSQLISDIVSLADKSKKEGRLKDSDLEKFENKITPMLNNEQKKMLKDIIGMIKK